MATDLKLCDFTYQVQHNPRCPSPFLIITCGTGGVIGREGNFRSYGKTWAEAEAEALDKIEQHNRLGRVRMNERGFEGIVWA